VPADHIFINTNEEYVQLVKEQLPEVPAERILAEPIHRNTAPSLPSSTSRARYWSQISSVSYQQ
jgi:mannose-1-phosphate guanylyltransferase